MIARAQWDSLGLSPHLYEEFTQRKLTYPEIRQQAETGQWLIVTNKGAVVLGKFEDQTAARTAMTHLARS